MILIFTIIAPLFLVMLYIIINLYRKNSTQEKILLGYLEYLDAFSRAIEYCDEKLKLIDDQGHFRSDDEVGFFFDEVKKMQDKLNNFIVK